MSRNPWIVGGPWYQCPPMLDFVLGIGLAGLLVRGWLRGFVREVIDLVSLVLGVWVAFALSAPLGDFLSDQFDVRSEVARIGSGILLFVLFGVAMTVAAHFLSTVMRLPGLNLMNRIGGSVVAVSWGIVIVIVMVNVGGALPFGVVDEAIEGSVVAEAIAGEDSIPQHLLSGFAGNGALAALSNLRALFGETRAVPEGTEVLLIPPAPLDELRQVRNEVELVVGEINERRTSEVVGALLTAAPMTAIAEARALTMYQNGRLSRETPIGGSVTDDLVAGGIRLEVDGEALALAATSRAAIDALLESPEAAALLVSPGFDRVGVSIVEGPIGILMVVVLGG